MRCSLVEESAVTAMVVEVTVVAATVAMGLTNYDVKARTAKAVLVTWTWTWQRCHPPHHRLA